MFVTSFSAALSSRAHAMGGAAKCGKVRQMLMSVRVAVVNWRECLVTLAVAAALHGYAMAAHVA